MSTILEVEHLARELREACRVAVEAGQTVAAEKFGEKTRKFIEWEDMTEQSKEGRRIQARYLLGKYRILDI